MTQTTLAEDYLSYAGGDIEVYHLRLRLGDRAGQAFFNALSWEDAKRIGGTLVDPFYKDTDDAVEKAIETLLELEKNA